jgi:hypothetical protein
MGLAMARILKTSDDCAMLFWATTPISILNGLLSVSIVWKTAVICYGAQAVPGRKLKVIILVSNLTGAVSRAFHLLPDVYGDDAGCANCMLSIIARKAVLISWAYIIGSWCELVRSSTEARDFSFDRLHFCINCTTLVFTLTLIPYL